MLCDETPTALGDLLRELGALTRGDRLEAVRKYSDSPASRFQRRPVRRCVAPDRQSANDGPALGVLESGCGKLASEAQSPSSVVGQLYANRPRLIGRAIARRIERVGPRALVGQHAVPRRVSRARLGLPTFLRDRSEGSNRTPLFAGRPRPSWRRVLGETNLFLGLSYFLRAFSSRRAIPARRGQGRPD